MLIQIIEIYLVIWRILVHDSPYYKKCLFIPPASSFNSLVIIFFVPSVV